jgi:glycosyltransferase involved in cell wall biosynthesis
MINKKLKILFTHRFSFGGGLVITHNLCNHLVALGHEITCVYIKNKLAHEEPPFFNNAIYNILWVKALPVVFPWMLYKFLKAYLKQNHIHAIISTGPEGLCFPRRQGKNPIIHIAAHHGSTYVGFRELLNLKSLIDFRHPGRWFHRLDFYFDRLRLLKADLVQCISYNQKVVSSKVIGLPENKIKVIYCGADTKKFFPMNGKESKHILYCGGLLPNKGIDVLLEAIRLVVRKNTIILDILGDGDWESYQQKVEAFGLSDYVRYHGYVPYHLINEYYKKGYLLVAPTKHEAFGLTIVEAMASGLPVIATAVTSVPELVKNGVTGILVPWNDAGALAEAIITLLDNPEMAKSMGQAGRERVEQMFTWDKAAKQMENLIIQTLKSKRLTR